MSDYKEPYIDDTDYEYDKMQSMQHRMAENLHSDKGYEEARKDSELFDLLWRRDVLAERAQDLAKSLSSHDCHISPEDGCTCGSFREELETTESRLREADEKVAKFNSLTEKHV